MGSAGRGKGTRLTARSGHRCTDSLSPCRAAAFGYGRALLCWSTKALEQRLRAPAASADVASDDDADEEKSGSGCQELASVALGPSRMSHILASMIKLLRRLHGALIILLLTRSFEACARNRIRLIAC